MGQEFGWSDTAPRLRSRLPNLNLLPADLLPAPLPWLTWGLALVGLGLLAMLYGLFYLQRYTLLENAALRDRLTVAQEAAKQLGLPIEGEAALPPGVLEDWAELRARQVDWGAVLGVVMTSAPGVQLGSVTQAGYGVAVAGEADSAGTANAYLQKLRDSGLFASLDMSIAALGATTQPTAAPVVVTQVVVPPVFQPGSQPGQPIPTVPPASGAPQPTVPVPAGIVQPPASVPQQPPVVRPANTPVPAPAVPTPTLAPRTPLATASPLGTVPAAAASATPLPQYDFIVQAKRETIRDVVSNDAHIRVRVVDAAGHLVPGLRLHIDSQGPWTDERPHASQPASDGTFDVPVSMGKFSVYLLNGYSEKATDLFTGITGQSGVHDWDVTYLKQTPGTPPAVATCPGCPTPTSTTTPIPSPTAISPGANDASLACVTVSNNPGDARRAVDGDVNNWWDANAGPVQFINLDFSKDANCVTRTDGVSYRTIEALELVVRTSGPAKQTHEVWTMYDNGSVQLEYTFADVATVDGQTISARFASARNIQQLRIRTIRSDVNIAWREIRTYEPLPPGFGSFVTSTPTASPSPTPTAPSGALAFGSAGASSENPGNPATAAIDGNPNTFWRPVTGLTGQYWQGNFSAPQTVQTVRFQALIGDPNATATPTPGAGTPTATALGANYRIVLLKPQVGAQQVGGARQAQDVDCFTTFVQQDGATIQQSCAATSGVSGIRIYVDAVGSQNLPPGLRETSAYPPAITPTPNATATFATMRTATVSACQTATALVTLTPQMRGAQATDTATPNATTTAIQATIVSGVAEGAATATRESIQTAIAATLTAAAPSSTPTRTATSSATATATATPTSTVTSTPTPLNCSNAEALAAQEAPSTSPHGLLVALTGWFAPRSADAAQLEQTAPIAPTVTPTRTRTTTATPRPLPPVANAPAPAAAPTQVVIGTPALSGAAGLPGQQPPQGRVSFVIQAKVLPGAP